MSSVQKILVPIDFSKSTESVFAAAVEQARRFDAELQLLYVVEDLAPYIGISVPHISLDEIERDMLDVAKRKMELFVEEHGEKGVKLDSAVRRGNVAAVITEFAGECDADLIIMGTHGYRGLEKMLLGSVAEKVIKTAPCSVMTVRVKG